MKEKDLLEMTVKLKKNIGEDNQIWVPIKVVVKTAKAHVRICLIEAGKEIDKCTTLEELDKISKKWLKELNRIRKLYM